MTVDSAMAAMITSRNKTIRRAPRSASGQAALAAGAGLVGQAIVLEEAGFVGGSQLTVRVNLHGVLDLLFRVGHSHMGGCYRRAVQRHESQPVPPDHSGPDRDKRGSVGSGVHVDRLQLADLAAFGVHYVLTTPVTDILSFKHDRGAALAAIS